MSSAPLKPGDRVQLKKAPWWEVTHRGRGPESQAILALSGRLGHMSVTEDEVELVPAASPGKRLVEIDDETLSVIAFEAGEGQLTQEIYDRRKAVLSAWLARAKAGDAQ